MRKIITLDEVPVQEVPGHEGHAGGRIQYVFTKDTIGSERLRFIVQEYDVGGFTDPDVHGVHPDMEQTYFVLEGSMEVHVGEESRLVGPGTCVYIPRNTRHWHRNAGEGVLRFLTLNCRHKDQ